MCVILIIIVLLCTNFCSVFFCKSIIVFSFFEWITISSDYYYEYVHSHLWLILHLKVRALHGSC